MKKVLIVVAHPDDEAYGCGGTLFKFRKQWLTNLCIFTDGGNIKVGKTKECVKNVSKILEIEHVNYLEWGIDQRLDILPLKQLVSEIDIMIDIYAPELVITHSLTDLNRDHRIIAEAVMVSTRPKPEHPVKEVWAMEILSATNWSFEEFGTFKPNLFVSLSEKELAAKSGIIETYSLELEKEENHARSIPSIITSQINRGHTVGVPYAEAFKIIRRTV